MLRNKINWSSYIKYWKTHTFITFSSHAFIIIALFLRVIIGNTPVIVSYKGEVHLMIFDDRLRSGSKLQMDLLDMRYNWEDLNPDYILWPIFKTSSEKFYTDQAWRPPFSSDNGRLHWLGTYELGRDVLASSIYGMQKSLSIGLMSLLLAILIGFPIGVGYSYLGKEGITKNIGQLIILIICIGLGLYSFLISAELHYFKHPVWLLFLLALIIYLYISNQKTKNPIILINPDFILVRSIEFMKSFPLLLLLLVILQWVSRPNIINLSIYIGILLSVSIAKYSRFACISESNTNYINGLQALGYSSARIIWFHLIPKIITDLAPMLALFLGNIVLLEASISFLGLGLPIEDISLGNMMYSSRSHITAWWVVVFPGLCIFWMVYCFQKLGDTTHEKWIS